jgi:Chs5-Arf1p-binding protein BUD7/BCH1
MQKAASEVHGTPSPGPDSGFSTGGASTGGGIMEDGSVRLGSGGPNGVGRSAGADDNASIRVLSGSPKRTGLGLPDGDGTSGIPVIKVSSESDREREFGDEPPNGASEEKGGEQEKEKEVEKSHFDATPASLTQPLTAVTPLASDHPDLPTASQIQPSVSQSSQSTSQSSRQPGEVTFDDIERGGSATTEGGTETGTENGDGGFSFANKRLCERWLDNLFMCLYEVRPPSSSSLL